MDKRQKMQVDSLARGVIVLSLVPDVPAFAEVHRLRRELDSAAVRLTDLHSEQLGAQRSPSTTSGRIQDAVRALRRRHLIRVSRRAKRLFKHDAGVLKALRVPPGRATPVKHANAALAMAKALRPHVAFCHGEGFPRGFLTELQEAGKQLAKMAKESDIARAAYSRVTRQLAIDVRDARELASVIDAELRALVLPGSELTRDERAALNTWQYQWAREIKLRKKAGRPPKNKRRVSSRAESFGVT